MIKSNVGKEYKTGLYIRLSKEDGDKIESDSITNQRSILQKFLTEHKEFILTDEYVDDGYSGTNANRPNFQRMLSDVRNGLLECVIVKDLSRFGRDYLLNGELIERVFPSENVRFISVLDDYDSEANDSALSDLMFPLKNVFNEYYSKDISRKIKKSFSAKRANGEFIGAYACYGYQKNPLDKHKLIIDEYASIIVKRIFSMFLGGMNMTQIANLLNAEGILSPTEYKRKNGSTYCCGNQILEHPDWTRCVIRDILGNETYIGNLVQGKTSQGIRQKRKRIPRSDWCIVENTHTAIIDKDIFEKVQFLLSRNVRCIKKEDNDIVALFSGYLRCGDCGMALSQRRQRERYISYSCSNYTRHGSKACSSHHISQNKLCSIILDDLNRIIASVEDLKAIVESEKSKIHIRKCANKISDLDKEISKKQQRKLKAYTDYQDGIMSKEDYLAFQKKCDDDINFLSHKKEVYETEEKKRIDFDNIPWIQNLLSKKKIETLDREIIYQMIDKITVYKDKTIVIRYKFSDEFENLLELYEEQH